LNGTGIINGFKNFTEKRTTTHKNGTKTLTATKAELEAFARE
jgi:hypothetical protein